MADNHVLLFLDGSGNSLHLRGALAGKRGQQQLILDGYGGVEAGVEFVSCNVELAAQLQVDVDGTAIRFVGGGAVGLVVVHLRHRRAPVYDKAAVLIVGKAGVANIELLRCGTGLVLQHYFREVRLRLQDAHGGEFLSIGALGAVVCVDNAVHVRVLNVGFLRFAFAGEVRRQLVGHIAFVFFGFLGRFVHLS